jgi:hypothetical protein
MTKYKRFMSAVQHLQGYQKQPARSAVEPYVSARHRAEKSNALAAAGRYGGTISSAVLRDLLADLPKDQQRMLTLVCVDGMTYRQAAEVLNVPVELMSLRMARARQALHERIASHVQAGGPADRGPARRATAGDAVQGAPAGSAVEASAATEAPRIFSAGVDRAGVLVFA